MCDMIKAIATLQECADSHRENKDEAGALAIENAIAYMIQETCGK